MTVRVQIIDESAQLDLLLSISWSISITIKNNTELYAQSVLVYMSMTSLEDLGLVFDGGEFNRK